MYREDGSMTFWGRLVFEFFGLLGLPFKILFGMANWLQEKFWNS